MRGIGQIGDCRASIGALLTAFAVVGAMGIASLAPALARDRGDDVRGRSHVRSPNRHDFRSHHRREFRAHERTVYRPAYGYDAPSHGYYPPPIVYAPPAPSAGINLVIPFHIR